MKHIVLTIALILLVPLGLLALDYAYTNSSMNHGSATFTPSENGLNRLTVEAPAGYYVLRYTVIPSQSYGAKNLFSVRGKGIGARPMGLSDESVAESNTFPEEGHISPIPVETHFRISGKLSYASVGQLPEDPRIIEKCGTYLLLTKDPTMYEKLDSVVETWSLESGPWTNRPSGR